MLKRDFTKSNKEYFAQNKVALIAVVVFILVGVLIASIFGMNGNFEIKGYNEFTITVSETQSNKFAQYQQDINDIINYHGGTFDTMSVAGEGDYTKLVVRYLDDLDNLDIAIVNTKIADKLGVDEAVISSHEFVEPIVSVADYVYTALAIILLVLIATIFAYARYNGASAMAIIVACVIGSLGFMSISAILRLSIGLNYFAMLAILNMLIIYAAINIFENMHKSSWLISGDYASAIDTSLKASKFRLAVISIALMLVGVLFVVVAPATIKYVSLNIMFMAVTFLAVSWYVIPFVWSVLITRCRKREYKIKPTTIEDAKDIKD